MNEKELMEAIKLKMDDIQKKYDEKADASEIVKLKAELDELRAKATTDQIEAIKNEFKGQLETLETALKTQGEEMTKLKTNVTEISVNPLATEIKSQIDAIKSAATGGKEEIALKALTLRSAITNNQNAYDLPDIGQLATRKLSMYDIFPKMSIGKGSHNGVIRYYDWDEDTIARAAAAVAEGAAFPESTAKWKKGSVTIQKIGDTLPVTEEFFEDEQMFAAELQVFLQTNVQLEVDRQLADGDGTGNTITGLLASIDAYTPVASGLTDPSRYDLIVKVSESITKTKGSKYAPDVVLMNITEINKMQLKKDQNYNYVLPPFVSRDGKNVAGMVVIECNILADNTMVVCDRRFGRIYEMPGMEIAKGYVGTQFTEDEMTLKIRKRMAFLIRAADKGGFAKVTDVTAALTTLAT